MDWKLTCRVCLETGDMVSLFDCDENNKQLSDKYTYCCGVEVTKDDPLPTLICLNCVDRLTSAYEFKIQCVSSTDTLKECLEDFINSAVDVPTPVPQEVTAIETITVKQDNGLMLQYTLPKAPSSSVVTTTGRPRGRPRKYPNQAEHYFSAADCDSKSNEGKMDSENEALQEPQPKTRGRKPQSKKQIQADENTQVTNDATEPASDNSLDTPAVTYPAKKKYVYDKTYVCETCNKTFSSKNALQIHVRRHLGIRPFECTICGYAFVLKPELRKHMWSHTGYSPYKCSMCDRRFRDMGSRQKHERVHMGLKPYKCTMCDKAFNYSYGLNAHMVTHTGEKKYSCDQCNKRFTRSAQVSIHNKRYHKELYQQQKLQADIKRSRQRVDLSGIFTAISKMEAAQGRGSDEEKCTTQRRHVNSSEWVPADVSPHELIGGGSTPSRVRGRTS